MNAGGAKTRPISETIGLVFGGLWSSLGSEGLPAGLRLPAEGVCFAITFGLIVSLWWRRRPAVSGRPLFRSRGYAIAVVLEIVAIYAATTILTQHGLKSYVIPAVGVIVGLHFIGLWQATRLTVFLWIAGCMCGVSILAALLPEVWGAYGPRAIVAGFGNALVLWIGAGRTTGPRSKTAPD
jgi:hypothetical protein